MTDRPRPPLPEQQQNEVPGPATMPPENVESFGKQTPMNRPGQPAELAPVYVMLASDEASYVSGATVAVTGGVPII